jgi:four helix bundle protein
VYRDAKLLHQKVLKIVENIPKEYKYNIGQQLLRCSLSVALNIAEGSGKHSNKELNRFVNTALGSLYETVAGVDIMSGAGLITPIEKEDIEKLCTSISNQLGGLKKKLL